MSKLILQPCGDSDANKHFVDTIKTPISIDRILKYLNQDDLNRLEPVFSGRTSIPVWGVTPGTAGVNINKWKKIEVGDVALFSREGKIFASSTVVEKVHNHNLALDLWQTNQKGMTWEYIYFLDELTNQNIPYSEFNKAVGYSHKYIIQGFNVLDPERSNVAIAELDLFSDRYFEPVDQKDYENLINLDDFGSKTDLEVKSKSRLEQGYLRRYLFGKKVVGTCCLCHEEFPVDMLCASHIKKRSKCSHDERLDYKNIVVPMCVNGCDAIFEKGYVVVSDQGIISLGRRDILTNGLNRKINQLLEKKCLNWNLNNEKYFSWHRSKFFE